jgi:hypothetical protein
LRVVSSEIRYLWPKNSLKFTIKVLRLLYKFWQLAVLGNVVLWNADRRLREAAIELGFSYLNG